MNAAGWRRAFRRTHGRAFRWRGDEQERPVLSTLRKIWRKWRSPHGAVWLPVLPPAGAFAELIVLIALIQIADSAIPGLHVTELEPSPYWLPILLLSLQYGTVAGLMAAGAATLAYVLSGLPEQVIDEHHFSYLLRVWALPILWIAVALILGQFRLRQIERKEDLQTALDQRTREAESLSLYARDLEQHTRQLERRITAAVPADGSELLDAIAGLETAGNDLTGALERLLAAAFPGAGITLYAVNPTGLEAGFSTAQPAQGAHTFAAGHAFYRAIAGERRALSVLSAIGEAELAGAALAAAPVLHGESGRAVAVIAIETADGGVLSAGIEERLAAVGRLIAPALAEPRIVVDNTERVLHGADSANRLTRGWRQFAWQARPPATPGGDEERPSPRPRILK